MNLSFPEGEKDVDIDDLKFQIPFGKIINE